MNMWRCSAWARRRLLPVKLFWIEQRQQLADKIVAMQAVLERLDIKIDGYEERCLKFEEENLRQ